MDDYQYRELIKILKQILDRLADIDANTNQ